MSTAEKVNSSSQHHRQHSNIGLVCIKQYNTLCKKQVLQYCRIDLYIKKSFATLLQQIKNFFSANLNFKDLSNDYLQAFNYETNHFLHKNIHYSQLKQLSEFLTSASSISSLFNKYVANMAPEITNTVNTVHDIATEMFVTFLFAAMLTIFNNRMTHQMSQTKEYFM